MHRLEKSRNSRFPYMLHGNAENEKEGLIAMSEIIIAVRVDDTLIESSNHAKCIGRNVTRICK